MWGYFQIIFAYSVYILLTCDEHKTWSQCGIVNDVLLPVLSSASGSFAPDPHQGSAPGHRWVPSPDPNLLNLQTHLRC